MDLAVQSRRRKQRLWRTGIRDPRQKVPSRQRMSREEPHDRARQVGAKSDCPELKLIARPQPEARSLTGRQFQNVPRH
jgi:hypothetical protein